MVLKKFNAETRRHDIYARVTNKIVAALENGVRPWRQPWEGGDAANAVMRPLRHNGQPYGGINTLMLWMASQEHGYMSRHWMTFRQAEELKAHVRKNEHGSMVVYADRMTRTEHLATGEDVERQVPFLKSYIVFNAEQIAGLPEHYYAKPGPKPAEPARIQRAEDFFAATKAEIRHGGVRAFYSPKHDFINMPPLAKFWNAEAYYGTLAHETIHWTKGSGRIERETAKSWGDEKYAYEEIVAELGASYICADLDITPKVPEQDENASYIQSWLKVLKGNTHAIFSAAAKAQTAADFLHKLQAREPGLENTARNNYDPGQPPALTNG